VGPPRRQHWSRGGQEPRGAGAAADAGRGAAARTLLQRRDLTPARPTTAPDPLRPPDRHTCAERIPLFAGDLRTLRDASRYEASSVPMPMPRAASVLFARPTDLACEPPAVIMRRLRPFFQVVHELGGIVAPRLGKYATRPGNAESLRSPAGLPRPVDLRVPVLSLEPMRPPSRRVCRAFIRHRLHRPRFQRTRERSSAYRLEAGDVLPRFFSSLFFTM